MEMRNQQHQKEMLIKPDFTPTHKKKGQETPPKPRCAHPKIKPTSAPPMAPTTLFPKTSKWNYLKTHYPSQPSMPK